MHKELLAERKSQGITQEELGQLINRHRETYARKERGQDSFTLEEAGKISKYLKVPIDVLFPDFFYKNSDKNAQ